MKYLLLIYTPEEEFAREHPGDLDGHLAMAADAKAHGAYVACDALQSPTVATTVRVRNGEAIISDGPFAETKEVLGGYYVLECADLDEAIQYASRIPPAAWGAIEIRPILAMPEWDAMLDDAAAKLKATAG